MITKIISGGQTGADQAGLCVGRYFGIETGGWATKGYKTKKGSMIDLKDYGLLENDTVSYKDRTWKNVEESDGTIRFAINFNSPGELCTLKAIQYFSKPYFDFFLNTIGCEWEPLVKDAVAWIKEYDIQILNVAGNSQRKIPGGDVFTQTYNGLAFILEKLKMGTEQN